MEVQQSAIRIYILEGDDFWETYYIRNNCYEKKRTPWHLQMNFGVDLDKHSHIITILYMARSPACHDVCTENFIIDSELSVKESVVFHYIPQMDNQLQHKDTAQLSLDIYLRHDVSSTKINNERILSVLTHIHNFWMRFL